MPNLRNFFIWQLSPTPQPRVKGKGPLMLDEGKGKGLWDGWTVGHTGTPVGGAYQDPCSNFPRCCSSLSPCWPQQSLLLSRMSLISSHGARPLVRVRTYKSKAHAAAVADAQHSTEGSQFQTSATETGAVSCVAHLPGQPSARSLSTPRLSPSSASLLV